MPGLVIQASGSIVEVDILELSMFPCLGVGICHTSIQLGMADRRKTESPPERRFESYRLRHVVQLDVVEGKAGSRSLSREDEQCGGMDPPKITFSMDRKP